MEGALPVGHEAYSTIAGPDGGEMSMAQKAAELAQEVVSRQVSVLVVVALEVIDVEDEHRQGPAGGLGLVDHDAELAHEELLVGLNFITLEERNAGIF